MTAMTNARNHILEGVHAETNEPVFVVLIHYRNVQVKEKLAWLEEQQYHFHVDIDGAQWVFSFKQFEQALGFYLCWA